MNPDRLRDFLNDAGPTVGRFELVREVGRGGMGIVYEAFDPDLGRTVALKVLKKEDAERLRREAASAAKLRHPNIVTVHEVGPGWIAMDFIEGRTLAEPAPPRERLRALEAAARAVAYAHSQGVVHRDLKPANILIERSGRVVLTDFGLSAAPEGGVAGTPGYMAPEGVTGPAADVWALGVMLREAGFRGRIPADSAAEVADAIGRRLALRKRLAALLAAALAVLGVVAAWPSASPQELAFRRWRALEEDFTRHLERDPRDVAALRGRAEVRRERGDDGRDRGRNPLPDYDSAERDLARAIEIDPDRRDLYLARGRLRCQRAVYKVKYGIDPLSDCAAAEEDLSRVVDLAGARVWRGNARFHRGVWRKNADDLRAAEEDFGSSGADALMRRGRVRGHLGRFDEAEADFAESIRLNPGSVWAWTWRGNARLAAGDREGAERFLTRAIQVNREFAEAWEQRGHARFEKGEAAGAASDYQEAIRLNPALEPLLAARLHEARRRK
jgi:tetratricopeptide (TPR) repeat protein